MAWTDAENARVLTIESMLNDLQTAQKNLMSKAQMRQLLLIKQAEIDSLTARVTALESLIEVIQNAIC